MRLIFTPLFAFVLLVFKATHLLPVLKLGAAVTLTVPLMRSVTLLLVEATLVKSVSLCAILVTVPEEQSAQPRTTKRPVLAGTH